ncbi:MAG: 3-isopropylmalate dehydratase small subunit [Peptococcaceae bacterium]|jgi:3-isopropylmalate/(R)-2-methylmalate dehydratase small subunit|nr:3-isopropylmalate dehydratase small subunit [Peptococcaceae bacterium]
MIQGAVRLVGDNINTDMISPARPTPDGSNDPMEKVRKNTLADIDPNFGQSFVPGSIIVAGKNFGCGSSREIAATVFKLLGASALVAESFARTFFRNAINIGLPIFEIPDPKALFPEEGHTALIDPDTGKITNDTTGQSVNIPPLPKEIQKIIDLGGLMAYVETVLAEEEQRPI